jgi:hypothetical protein
LEDKNAAYDTASFGETTSADELVMKSSSSAGEVEIFRQSPVSQKIDEAREAAVNIKVFEDKVVDHYLGLDLYRSKNLNYKKISFNDLTLEQNVNYIKYNIKNSDDAIKMFKIT